MIKGTRNILLTASKIDLLDNVSDLNCQAILSFRTSDTNILGLSVNISFHFNKTEFKCVLYGCNRYETDNVHLK